MKNLLILVALILLLPAAKAKTRIEFNKYRLKRGETIASVLKKRGFRRFKGRGNILSRTLRVNKLSKRDARRLEPGTYLFIPSRVKVAEIDMNKKMRDEIQLTEVSPNYLSDINEPQANQPESNQAARSEIEDQVNSLNSGISLAQTRQESQVNVDRVFKYQRSQWYSYFDFSQRDTGLKSVEEIEINRQMRLTVGYQASDLSGGETVLRPGVEVYAETQEDINFVETVDANASLDDNYGAKFYVDIQNLDFPFVFYPFLSALEFSSFENNNGFLTTRRDRMAQAGLGVKAQAEWLETALIFDASYATSYWSDSSGSENKAIELEEMDRDEYAIQLGSTIKRFYLGMEYRRLLFENTEQLDSSIYTLRVGYHF